MGFPKYFFLLALPKNGIREFTFNRVSADILLALHSPFTFSRVSADILLALYSLTFSRVSADILLALYSPRG